MSLIGAQPQQPRSDMGLCVCRRGGGLAKTKNGGQPLSAWVWALRILSASPAVGTNYRGPVRVPWLGTRSTAFNSSKGKARTYLRAGDNAEFLYSVVPRERSLCVDTHRCWCGHRQAKGQWRWACANPRIAAVAQRQGLNQSVCSGC